MARLRAMMRFRFSQTLVRPHHSKENKMSDIDIGIDLHITCSDCGLTLKHRDLRLIGLTACIEVCPCENCAKLLRKEYDSNLAAFNANKIAYLEAELREGGC